MKMAKATDADIDAAGDAMSVFLDISGGYYPARNDDVDDDPPTFFDPNEFDHLRKFYELMKDTLDKSPGWPGRVIGGMCYVILYDNNKIIDQAAQTLELHPQFKQTKDQRDILLEALNGILDYFRSGNCISVDQATIHARSPEIVAAFAAFEKATKDEA